MFLTISTPRPATAAEIANSPAIAPATAPAAGSPLAVLMAILAAQAASKPAFGPDTAGTITTGGSAQQMLAAADSPRYVMLTNDGDDLIRAVIGPGNPSATVGRRIEPGGYMVVRTAERIAVWGATTGQAFSYSVEVA